MTKKSEPKYECPHDPGLTDEEEAAVQWLSQMLGDMTRSCSPAHMRRALTAHDAIGKLFNKLHKMHDLVHQQEAELARAEIILVGMVGMPHHLGLVNEEDLN